MIPPIVFKDPTDEAVFPLLDWRVRWLFERAREWAGAIGSVQITITSITSGHHLSGEHADKRAVDLRIWDLGLGRWESFAVELNSLLGTAGGRPCALCGKTDPHGQHNDHFHLQVSAPYQGPTPGKTIQI